ncbi:hypothetical protein Nepgr_009052 [Nepenthes gracilis]|uniref:Uncharacterized protein n=1 Tax=Nepenthes gracilis TaxID=150966 RepID=A0AAD3XJT4_NEPGR|nr:hypothetical protein Nepgr_009052 [Nepenthes gracilis]
MKAILLANAKETATTHLAMPFSSLKSPTSPLKDLSVGNLQSLGPELFKKKKSKSSSSSAPGHRTCVHQHRMMDNRWLQWAVCQQELRQ